MSLFTRNSQHNSRRGVGRENHTKNKQHSLTLSAHSHRIPANTREIPDLSIRTELTERHTLLCPCCAKPLAARNLDDVRVDVCTDCGGVWTGPGKVPILVRRGPDALTSLEREMGLPAGNIAVMAENLPYLLCPQCEVPMESGPYAYDLDARLDHCSECHGSWVGAGELAMIIGHYTDKREASRMLDGIAIVRSR